MGEYLKILGWVVAGIALLWIGYSLFFGTFSPNYPYFFPRKRKGKNNRNGANVDPQVCLVCSTKLARGSRVQTTAFPPASGSIDRLMYVRGCSNCLNGNAPRKCPICRIPLDLDDYLIARMFERERERKNHVHVLGCNRCRKPGDFNR